MKLEEEINEAVELLRAVMPIVPVISREIKPLADAFVDVVVDWQIRAVRRFEAAGMSREEAILLTIDAKVGLAESLKNIGLSRKKL